MTQDELTATGVLDRQWLMVDTCSELTGEPIDTIRAAIESFELESRHRDDHRRGRRFLVPIDALRRWHQARHPGTPPLPNPFSPERPRPHSPASIADANHQVGILIDRADQLVGDTATFEMSRMQRASYRWPVIYAVFAADGTCLYVGKSLSSKRILFGGHHCIDINTEWETLRVWRAKVRNDEELSRLEADAIQRLQPTLNVDRPHLRRKAD